MDLDRLERQLAIEEGSPDKTYLDSKRILSGGIGHNLIDEPEPGYDKPGIPVPVEMRRKWFQKDVLDAIEDADLHLPWWRDMNDVRQNALLDLLFNMGWGDGKTVGLSTFHNTLQAFEDGNYIATARGIKTSQYAREVGPTRSGRIARMIETGEWPHDIP